MSLGPTSERLLALWKSGEVARVRAEVRTQEELAARLGFTFDSYRHGFRQLRREGHAFPAFDQLVTDGAVVEVGDFEGEEPTNPCAPPLAAIPPGHLVKGVSTLVGADGETKAQWIKTTKQEEDRYTALIEAMSKIAEPWQGKAEPTPPPSFSDEDLLCVYPMGDPHLGMHAWADEAGDNFDLSIAERNLYTAADRLVSLAPKAERGLIANLGDFFHADGKGATTTKGTRVDVDTRWPKVLATGVRLMRRIIERALDCHKHVTVINEIGNHDDHSSIMLSVCLAQFFERETRVTIDTSPAAFHWYRFGSCLLGFHHGHLVKHRELGEIMAADRPEDWGETEHRFFHVGHVHHDTVKELRGVTVESHRTLATADAWHHGQGYRSGHDMKMDVLHRRFGRINRHIVGIDQIRALCA